ncbi:malto-oligosyltrehalose synthase [Arthrobacter sp. H14]|uniref:malto-oligosyltrehalose synthase n=1 Tax=Arthrobacter sp. H14 TaxID=1312959 RepID=UPI000478E7CF|nr:malto-oligosyltrehalose synthase [Arthrobacter sp. H14]
MKVPQSTYRLQIRPECTLQDAATLVDYLKALGVDWVYVSPILTAEQGSDHGYDVTDPSAIDPVRGGPEGLEALASAAHGAGMGVLADIVPNHMGVATPVQNPWWWSLLKEGSGSRYAEAFDVDWDLGGGKIRIPVLGDSGDELEKLTLVPAAESKSGEPELHYYDNCFPVADGTFDDDDADPQAVHSRQHYELMNWRRADDELNYRRFFAVNTLAGIRVEEPWVFDEAHAEVLRWVREGLVDGLRIDHPDGLADPAGYLDRLRSESGGTYVLVEKILEPGESLPEGWACEGTSGYDALAQIDRLWVDPAGRETLDALDSELRGSSGPVSWQDMTHGTKRMIADGILHSEALRLARLVPADAGLEPDVAADAIGELLTCFPVYRSYLPQHREYLEEAARLAKQYRPDLSDAVDTLRPLLSDVGNQQGAPAAPAAPAALGGSATAAAPGAPDVAAASSGSDAAAAPALAIRFQQTSGMVMAKGVEDTAFYRYTRLTSLTEVGADPSEFSLDVDQFHLEVAGRQQDYPYAMTTLSTHDTKRGEDVRARISVLSEMAPRWAEIMRSLQDLAPLEDGPLANLLWQAVIGAWPASRERLHAYAEKASREAGNSTLWTAPDEEFEAAMHRLIDAAFDNPEVNRIVSEFVQEIDGFGKSNSLSAKMVQLTMPGVPDVYQGTELWEDSLVDPDNRRPVDFDERRRLLAQLDGGTSGGSATGSSGGGIATGSSAGGSSNTMADRDNDDVGLAKLLVTSRALRLKRDRPELFTSYTPFSASGDAAGHLVGFDRGGAITLATRLPAGLKKRGGWGDTAVALPSAMRDELTGRSYPSGEVPVAEVLNDYPVALLVAVAEEEAQ